MQKIVLIGQDSYLAQGFEKYLSPLYFLTYQNWQNHISLLKQADVVINFCISPLFSQQKMTPDDVIDIQIAKELLSSKAHYVFLSSRKVYGTSTKCLIHKETDSLKGIDFYAQNKIMTERILQSCLTDRLTILRLSNIIGEPLNRFGYQTFMGWISESYLKTKKLNVNQNINAQKDFISKKYLHKCLKYVLKNRPSGIYNLSSGFASSVKDILSAYVGAQNIIVSDKTYPLSDQFVLDNTRLKTLMKSDFTSQELYHDLNEYKDTLTQMTSQSIC